MRKEKGGGKTCHLCADAEIDESTDDPDQYH